MEVLKILLSLLLVVGLSTSRKLPSGRRHYTIKVTEAGETFEETDDLDEDENIEVIHVPAHNDLKEVTFVIDHNQHLTMRLVEESGRCLLSRALTTAMDESGEEVDDTASEEAEALDEEQGAGPQSVQTEMHTLVIGDKIDASARAQLSPAMLRLCDGRDIYRMEPMDDVMSVETDDEAEGGTDTLMRVSRDNKDVFVSNICGEGELHKRCKLSLYNCRYLPNTLHYYTCRTAIKTSTTDKQKIKEHCKIVGSIHSLSKIMCCKYCCHGGSSSKMPCDSVRCE